MLIGVMRVANNLKTTCHWVEASITSWSNLLGKTALRVMSLHLDVKSSVCSLWAVCLPLIF